AVPRSRTHTTTPSAAAYTSVILGAIRSLPWSRCPERAAPQLSVNSVTVWSWGKWSSNGSSAPAARGNAIRTAARNNDLFNVSTGTPGKGGTTTVGSESGKIATVGKPQGP